MSSSDTIKKRKVKDNDVEEETREDTTSMSAAEKERSTLSAILAEMKDMKCKLSHMDELESKSALMQNEIDSMKERVSHIDELERKNEVLEAKLHLASRTLKRSVKLLLKEIKWEYSAPPIPDSHWLEHGFDADIIEEMEGFLSNIKDITCDLRSGDECDEIKLEFDNENEALSNPLPYTNALLPHWREFANAIQVYPGTFNDFTIHNIQLTSAVLELLIPALENKLCYTLTLTNNDFTVREGIKFVLKLIKANHNLREINWIENRIGSMEDAKYLARDIINHPSINNVRLENCFENIDGYGVLCTLLASGKQFGNLDFDRNNIQTNGGTEISDYISNNPPLKNLFMSANKLNDNDAILIAKALKKNTNLEQLYLFDNDIIDIGRTALVKAVYDTTSLNSMSDCNHICQIYLGLEGDMDVPVGCSNRNMNFPSSNARRGAKIYQLLSKRNEEGSNVKHFNAEFDGEDEEEDSLKLVPKVLECVHRYSRASLLFTVHPLSIIYEIIRGWKMPELYEKQS